MKKTIKERVNEIQNIKEPRKVPKILSKFLITAVLFLIGLIYIKNSPDNKMLLYKKIYENSFKFTQANNIIEKYLGDIDSFDNLVNTTTPVFKEQLNYTEASKYKDGAVLTVDSNYLVPVLESGIVVYVGEKKEYGNTVIVQQVNGIDMWYGNVTNINAKMYEYIEKGSLLGETINNKLYVVWEENGEYKDYKEHLK